MTTRALEDKEIKAIFEQISGCNAKRNRAMLIVGIGMALRASELVGLNVGDVIDTNGNVKAYVTIRGETAKFGKVRTVRIGEGLQKRIAEYIDWKTEHGEAINPDAPLFVSQRNGHLTRQGLFDLVERIFERAGIDQSPHSLRKTGATLYYIESGYDLIATQQFLGHADPSTTRRYIGLTTEQLRDYSEKLSDHLLFAIENGTLDTRDNMSRDFLKEVSDEKLIMELIKRGYAVMIREIEPNKAKIIPMRKVA